MKSTNFIVKILKNIKHSLVVNRNEPHVEQKRDRFGNKYWQVRDYKTNKLYSFGSDRDVIAWLEKRHNCI